MEKESSRFEEIRERLHLQNLGSYIRYGEENIRVYYDTYEHREREAERMLAKSLAGTEEEEEREKIRDVISDYVKVMEEITFSLGMKCGAALMQELFSSYESDA